MNINKPSYEELKNRIKELESELANQNTQKSIEESEAQFRLVFENSKNPLLWADAKTGILIKVNNATQNLFERTENELVGQHQSILHPPETKEKYIQKFKKHVENKGAFNMESEIITKSGKIKIVEVSSTVIKIGDSEINQGVFIDITEKKQAEELLRKSEEKYRHITECLPEVIFEIDLQGNITYINSRAYELTGYSKEDFKNGFNVLNGVIPEDREKIIENMKLVLKGEKSKLSDYTLVKKDGSIIPIILHSIPIIENNIPIGFRGFFIDISDRKEQELIIQKQNEELIELNAAKDKFFSIIAHDLKSPFSVILGFSNMLSSNIDKFDKNKINKIVSTLNNAAIQTSKLLENLLDWSRIQRGLLNIKLNSNNLKIIALETELLYFENAQKKSIILQNNITENVFAQCDEDITKTILRNLISNAIKFTNENGKVSISAKKSNDFVTVIINDTGIGIDTLQLPYLFSISNNITTAGTANEMGTGLGLILCKELVEKQGGKIWVDSEVGKGTTIYFTLKS
ncbi:MAG: hypothetical protein A2033_12125 [Bacteroidetes bacterium GWA2_31_9]|nr:MAG: hypothetical protein A2033_12125 [Bacteroidetes bacterium GWA2_31_9]